MGGKMYSIYTDGSALGNPGPGGRGVVILSTGTADVVELSGCATHTTNNIMELQAVIEALQWVVKQHKLSLPDTGQMNGLFATSATAVTSIAAPIDIYTDSTYVHKGVTQWLNGWAKRGWKKHTSTQSIANVELRQTLHAILPLFENISWHRVKAHAGNKRNERVDDLARTAASNQ